MVYLLIHLVHDIGKEKPKEKMFDHVLFYRIGPGGFQLLIIQADPSQAGIYTCLAYSKAGEAKQQFHLTVLGIDIKFLNNMPIIIFSSSTDSTRKHIIYCYSS